MKTEGTGKRMDV